MKQLYLVINSASVVVPLLFSFHPEIQFYKKWKVFFPAVMIALCVFLPWDMLFTHLGVWGFNKEYILGIYFFNLPLEEVLFFICIPYACVFSYHCFSKFLQIDRLFKYESVISIVLILFLASLAVLNLERLYTSFTFAALAIFVLILKFFIKVSWLHKFYFSYLFLLIPFFIVNGLLTGTGPDAPVVWYNNAHNLGIRMLSIPFEDTFYGMFLLMLTVAVYEYLNKRYES